MKYIKLYLLLLILIFVNNLQAADSAQEIIKKAMKDELERSMDKLSLENLKKPFFISYTIIDSKKMSIRSTLGAIVKSEEKPSRKLKVRVLVGDYNLNNENFVNLDFNGGSEFSFGSSSDLPLDNDYLGIRRSLWLESDGQYKRAAETYEGKVSAMKQQNLSQEDSLPDMCKVKKVVMNSLNETRFSQDKLRWESVANELSGMFKDRKDIFSSSVAINFINSDIYFLNSEGTETSVTKSLAAVQVNAYTIAPDGEPLNDHVLYYELTPEDLPSIETMKKDVQGLIEEIAAIRNAPVFDESYSGPVLFEDQAAAEVIAQKILSSNGGLIADRKGIYSNPQMMLFMSQTKDKSLDDKISKKVLSNTLSIIAKPLMKSINNINLIGSYNVDAEGVVPDDELVLIDKGILKNFLNGRTPCLNASHTNGHCGYYYSAGGYINPSVGPSVILLNSSVADTKDELKNKLIEKAKEEGLKFAYIVKKVRCPNSGATEGFSLSSIISFAGNLQKKGGMSKPIAIYRVNVDNGKEEMVRAADLTGININSLKKVLGSSNNNLIYNTMHTESSAGLGSIFSFANDMVGGGSSGLSGSPLSIIMPDALLIEELDIQKEKRVITSKPPIVENPVGK